MSQDQLDEVVAEMLEARVGGVTDSTLLGLSEEDLPEVDSFAAGRGPVVGGRAWGVRVGGRPGGIRSARRAGQVRSSRSWARVRNSGPSTTTLSGSIATNLAAVRRSMSWHVPPRHRSTR